MKKALVLLVVGGLLSMAGAPVGAATKTKGSFTAQAIPYADYTYSYPTTADTYTCFDGQEDVHKVLETVEAPITGRLEASISGFEGDWEIALFQDGLIAEMPYTTQWVTQAGKEVVSKRVTEGTKITIGVCNWSSSTLEVEVRYRFEPGDGFDASDPASGWQSIDPGRKAHLKERVPVNFVFLGYDEDEIDVDRFLRGLPERYRPLVRVPAYLYGIDNYLGLDYTYRYNVHFTEGEYEDHFFDFLTKTGSPEPPNTYQVLYTAQDKNVLGIAENLNIPAPAVERWLVENPPKSIDPTENTVFFIDWYGRKDFQHHTYTKMGEPDSDAGYDFGVAASQATIAWGGTPPDDPETGFGKTSRLWFYDLSAGPEYWSKNYLVDVADTDGDGQVNYRMPPSWEYSKEGFRHPDKLSGDLSKVARYVAIDLLFTTSPLYTPALNFPDVPETVNLDLNTYEGAPGFDASEEWVQSDVILASFEQLLPHYKLTIDEQDLDFFEPRFAGCYLEWMQLYFGPNCYEDRPYSIWANFFTHNALNLPATHDDKKVDYEASAFNYATPDGTGYTFGYADDNYLDGTQSFTHTFVDTEYQDYLGMTDIIIHEFGHHFGASHPHDGYDYEDDVDHGGWYDEFQYVWAGTQNNSVMSYLSTNNEFSQFDRDNMDRWMTSTYLNALNEIAGEVVDKNGISYAQWILGRADRLAAESAAALGDHDYRAAVAFAKEAYELGTAIARDEGVRLRGRWTGTKVLSEDQGAAAGYYTAASHRLYHRMFADRPEDMIPPEVLATVKGRAAPPLLP